MDSKRQVVIEVTGFNGLIMEIAVDLAPKGLDQAHLIIFPDTVLELRKEFVDGQGLFV